MKNHMGVIFHKISSHHSGPYSHMRLLKFRNKLPLPDKENLNRIAIGCKTQILNILESLQLTT